MKIIYHVKVSHGSTVGCVIQLSDGRLVVCDTTEGEVMCESDAKLIRQIASSALSAGVSVAVLDGWTLVDPSVKRDVE